MYESSHGTTSHCWHLSIRDIWSHVWCVLTWYIRQVCVFCHHIHCQRLSTLELKEEWCRLISIWMGINFLNILSPGEIPKVQKYMCPGLTQPITVAIESHHYSQQTAIFSQQMNVSFLPNQLRRFINHHLRVVSHLIIWFRDLLSQHHLLCAVKINPTCDTWGKDLTKDGEGSTWDTLCWARYTDLA